MTTLGEVRTKYLQFFRTKDHAIIPSASIVPENDATTLFTGSGMQPLLPFLLGEKHPSGARLANSQKCFRAEDIDEVGDNRHTTFFEMLGNWSLGDYFKERQLEWFFGFLTDEIGLDPKRLYVTVFAGDDENGISRDDESVRIWKELFAHKGIEAKDVVMLTEERASEIGMQGGRIFSYGSKKNWWSRAGVPSKMPVGEPGGPDSEVFFEYPQVVHDEKFGKHCHPNCDCGRFVEIGNSVFMEYVKREKGFEKLPQSNVDFGGGLERITAAKNDAPDIFQIDALQSIISELEKATGLRYGGNESETVSYRIVADHIRGAVFMIAEGLLPSNTDQGYVVRRLLRRAVRFSDKIGVSENSLARIAMAVIRTYGDAYPLLAEKSALIEETIAGEELKFRKTLQKGLMEFERFSVSGSVSGRDAFILFSTFGFPLELTVEIASERGLKVDEDEYHREFNQHRTLSRTASKEKFKGGLADSSDMSLKYHTATHLLNEALRRVLGDHVYQKGSNITPERLRFDFSHGEKMTDDQKKRVEEIVNEAIRREYPVTYEIVPIDVARKRGAIGIFGDKYGDEVKIYQVGNEDERFSLEFCGGPHVGNTAELGGTFRIVKEEAVSAGVRRIKAVLQ